MTDEPVRGAPYRGRVVVLLGIVLVALNLRIAIGAVSPILETVRADVPLTDPLIGVLSAVPVISFAIFGASAPLLARRIGLEPALVLAMVLSAVGEVVRSVVDSPVWFLGWSVLALAGMGMGNVLLPPLVKRYFPDRIGAVTAAYSVAMSISAAVPPLLAVPLARSLGWRWSLASWAVVGAVAVVPWLWVVVRSARARTRLRGLSDRGHTDATLVSARHRDGGRVWRSPLAWGLALTFAVNTMNVYVLFGWLPRMLADVGVEPGAAGRWLALFAILGLPPALVVPVLAERMRRPWRLVVLFAALYVVGYTGLLVSPTRPLGLWIVLLGLAPGAFPLLLTLINLRTRTPAGASSLSGFVQGTGYGLAAAGPVLVGLAFDVTGRFTEVVLVLIASMGLLAAAGAVACRPVVLEDTWGGSVRPHGKGAGDSSTAR